MARQRRKFPPQFKTEAVQFVLEIGRPVAESPPPEIRGPRNQIRLQGPLLCQHCCNVTDVHSNVIHVHWNDANVHLSVT